MYSIFLQLFIYFITFTKKEPLFVFTKWTYMFTYSEELLDGNLKITKGKQKQRNEITFIHIYFSFSFISIFFTGFAKRKT